MSTTHAVDLDGRTWVFGYGSLIWRPDFPFDAQRDGWIEGWQRRFLQGSPDHRGTSDDPGRVVTLIADPGTRVWGRVYRVEGRVLAHLDHREKAGYSHHRVQVTLRDGTVLSEVLLYVAGPDNPYFLGPAPTAERVAQVRRCRGPSGTNLEYVLRLADALVEMGVHDPEVHDLADLAAPGWSSERDTDVGEVGTLL
jgi:cation transport regulator ChaC